MSPLIWQCIKSNKKGIILQLLRVLVMNREYTPVRTLHPDFIYINQNSDKTNKQINNNKNNKRKQHQKTGLIME